MDILLVERLHLIQPGNLSTPWVDVRSIYLSSVNASAPAAPLVTYANNAGTANPATLAMVGAAIASSAYLPPEISDLKYGALVYATMLSDDVSCPDISEVPVVDAITGKVTCGCSEGKVCISVASQALVISVVGVDALPTAVGVVALVAVCVIELVVIVFFAVFLRRRAQAAVL